MSEPDRLIVIAKWPRDLVRAIKEHGYRNLVYITLMGWKWKLVFERRNKVKKLILLAALLWPGLAGAASLTLNWIDNALNEDGFIVERRFGDCVGEFVNFATLPANQMQYVDASLGDGVGACYRVYAFNAAGNSAPTNAEMGFTPVIQPVTAPAPTATMAIQCAVVAAAQPPTTQSGWTARFRVDGSNVSSSDSSAPFTRNFIVAGGNHNLSVNWTRSATAAVLSPATLLRCE